MFRNVQVLTQSSTSNSRPLPGMNSEKSQLCRVSTFCFAVINQSSCSLLLLKELYVRSIFSQQPEQRCEVKAETLALASLSVLAQAKISAMENCHCTASNRQVLTSIAWCLGLFMALPFPFVYYSSSDELMKSYVVSGCLKMYCSRFIWGLLRG
ncbi:hypothetical protein CEXT_674701 [Caerostris extrusa]|uniref:Uncharacterized protein n=1 Tax=Caerostris extrusa TaxID=172846 RepID=A0AAV4NB08_CAEEX|nr:hypothetical protein CEXT_674701 [Caerostris extrusa]